MNYATCSRDNTMVYTPTWLAAKIIRKLDEGIELGAAKVTRNVRLAH